MEKMYDALVRTHNEGEVIMNIEVKEFLKKLV